MPDEGADEKKICVMGVSEGLSDACSALSGTFPPEVAAGQTRARGFPG